MRDIIAVTATAAVGFSGWLVGGFDIPLLSLVIFMVIDYITGLIVAGIFHRSPKSTLGGLESHVGWKGLVRKICTLLLVVVARMIDLLLGVNIVRGAVIIGFCANESISIIENAGLMGLPIPEILTKSIDQLQSKGKEEDSNNGEKL